MQVEKWANNLIWQFLKEEIKADNNYLKMCSILLTIRESKL